MAKGREQKTEFAVRSGDRIRRARQDRRWSQRELSAKTDNKLSPSRIANYEQGLRELGIQESEILGKALHVQPAYLLGVTKLKTALTPLEEELVRNYRALPENERESYFKRIEALALAYRSPVADERLGDAWHAPGHPDDQPPSPAPNGTHAKPKNGRKGRRKHAKQP